MKTSKTIIWMFVIAASFYVPRSFAINRDLFPNINSVQPIPTGTLPNISGNIDWPNVDSSSSEQGSQNSNPANPNITNTAGNSYRNDTNGGVIDPNQTSWNTVDPTTSNNNMPTIGNTQNGVAGQPTSNTSGNVSGNGSSIDPTTNSAFYNFGTVSPTNNEQAQNVSTENDGTSNGATDSSATDQNVKKQNPISESTYAWALAFGSIILLMVAFIIWILKKAPADVNPS